MDSLETRGPDVLGEMLRLAGAYRVGYCWRVPQVAGGFVATGVHDDSAKAWVAIPTGLEPEHVKELTRAGLAQPSEFRQISTPAGMVCAAQRYVDPMTMSPNRLLLHARAIAARVGRFNRILQAKDVVDKMGDLLGQPLPSMLVPAWETIRVADWTTTGGTIATGPGSITSDTWETLTDRIRGGAPDGIRLTRDGQQVRVATAATSATFLIDLDRSEADTSLLDLAVRAFHLDILGPVQTRLEEASRDGNTRRLFHAEHTHGGTEVLVFNPWLQEMVEHPGLTALWHDLVTDRTIEAKNRLHHAIWEHFVNAGRQN